MRKVVGDADKSRADTRSVRRPGNSTPVAKPRPITMGNGGSREDVSVGLAPGIQIRSAEDEDRFYDAHGPNEIDYDESTQHAVTGSPHEEVGETDGRKGWTGR